MNAKIYRNPSKEAGSPWTQKDPKARAVSMLQSKTLLNSTFLPFSTHFFPIFMYFMVCRLLQS